MCRCALSIMIILAVVAAIGSPGCTRAVPVTTEQTTIIQTTAFQTVTNSTNEEKSKFSEEDLLINGIRVGAVPAKLDKMLGAPKEQKTTMDQVTGNDLLIYTYEGLHLIFTNDSRTDELFHLKSVEATNRGYLFVHDLQVGDSVQDVINAFAREGDETTYQGFTVLYGDPNLMERDDVAGEIAFGYFNDSQALYLAMKPPYMSEYATVYDKMAFLRFTFENQTVTGISWMLGSGAE